MPLKSSVKAQNTFQIAAGGFPQRIFQLGFKFHF
jgi:hypothetical protein